MLNSTMDVQAAKFQSMGKTNTREQTSNVLKIYISRKKDWRRRESLQILKRDLKDINQS